jgi:hypothetical protein
LLLLHGTGGDEQELLPFGQGRSATFACAKQATRSSSRPIEAIGHHRRIPDDTPRDLTYVWFIILRNGLVVNFPDDMNPLQLSPL